MQQTLAFNGILLHALLLDKLFEIFSQLFEIFCPKIHNKLEEPYMWKSSTCSAFEEGLFI